jgi:HEAT repeat protein
MTNDAATLAAARRYVADRSSRRETQPAFDRLRSVDTEALRVLVESLLVSADPADRALAVRLAAYLGEGEGLNTLLGALEREHDALVLAAVAEALGELQGEEASAHLEKLATNPDPGVRQAVAASLYGRRDSSALSALLLLINDTNDEVSGWAAWALADNFEPSEERDTALEHWLRRAGADSQLAEQVRSALESSRSVSAPPTRKRTVKRERPTSKPRSFTVLVASANPLDTTQLAIDEEVRSLTASVRATPARDSIKLEGAWALRPYDLLVELNEHKPEVLHFSGHGMADGRLVFVDEARNPKPVDGAAIASTLVTAGESVRVVVLNACFSADLAERLTEHVDVAVGMDRPVGDDAARLFAQAFYSALGYGTSVGRAFDQARTALMLEGFPEHSIARLSAREGVDPYEVFLVDRVLAPGEEPADDIESLRRVTANHLEHLAQHASLRTGDRLEIARSVGQVLRQRAETGSLFVVGAPGSGKSGAMYRFASDLAAAGRDVVVLAADLLTATGGGGLREEVGISLDLVDALASWKGSESAFLIIDALDAARGREALTVLLEVIERVARREGRWRVVASVRTFDLRHNPDLQTAIPAKRAMSDEPYADAEFAAVRHVAVGDLSDTELESLAATSPGIHEFLGAATPQLRDLLRVPFNLRLLSALPERDEVDRQRLHNLRTQLELLDLYWERRVLAPAIGRDARELLTASLCRAAVRTMRLQVSRDELREAAAANTPHFEELLAEGVLVETRGAGVRKDTVGFAHHVLFDYAVHRLLLAGEPDDIARELADSEELVLLARPSLVFTLVSAWEADQTRSTFWNLVLRLGAHDVPAPARLVGPTVAADRLVDLADAASLVAAIDCGHPQAAFVLRHVVGARAAAGLPTRPLAGGDLKFWTQLAVEISGRITHETAYPLRLLVWGMSSERDRLDEEDVSALGVSARALLNWGWSQTPAPLPELQVALEGVARSCPSDPSSTDALLSHALDPERVPHFGYIELRPLTDEVPSLARCIPDFVARLYETAFGYDEESEETTPVGSGQILRLTSTRRQDWEMVRYGLAQEYPSVLEANPPTAVRALAAACAHEASRWSASSQHRVLRLNTLLGETEAVADGSEYWGSSGYHRDVASMLDAFENALAEDAPQGAAAESIIGVLVQAPLPAAIWGRVLRAAARCPEKIAALVAGIPASPDALMSSELHDPICDLLRIGPSYWSPEAELEIEAAVMSLPDRYPDHFVMCVPAQALQSVTARELRAELEARSPEELPRERVGGARWEAVDDDEELRARGIEPEHPATRDLLRAVEPVSQFVSAHVNSAPSPEEARNVIEPIVRLRQLRGELRAEVEESVLDDAQAWLSEAAAALASQTPLPVEEQSVALARELALEGATGAIPRRDPDIEQFDKRSPGWGVPSGRIDAARALLLLSRDPQLAGPDLFASIEALANDEHPTVRWMVAHSLGFACQTDSAKVWQLVNRMAEHERSAQVLQALLDPLSRFLDERVDDVATIIRRLYDREMADRRHESLLRALTSFLIQLWIWRGHPSGRKLVDEWIEDILPNAGVAHPAFYDLRHPITHGTDSPDDSAIRQRAVAVWADLTRAASDAFHAAEPALRAGEESSPELKTQLGDVARLLDASATEIYFGSGAYAEEAEREEPLSASVRRRFYREGSRILDVLVPVGVPSIAHHLLQTLSAYVEIDPRGILLRVGQVLEAGRRWGYQLEGLAEQEFVRLVEVYLASHRDLLLGDRQSRHVLISSLDGFVEAGWPSARRLLYGLDDMFR